MVITTSEIYNSVYIEEITRGPEGCCLELREARKIDLEEFRNKFSLIGETSGFRVLGWNSPRSFNFSIHDRKFKVTKVGSASIDITEMNAANKSLKRGGPEKPAP